MYYWFIKFVKSVLLLLFIFQVVIAVNAQKKETIDSLTSLLETAHGENKIDILVELAIEFVDKDPLQSINYSEKGYHLALDVGDSSRIVYAGRIFGEILRRNEKIDESIKLLNYLLPISRRNNLKVDFKYILSSIASAYTVQANYDKALEYDFQFLIIGQTEGNKAEISIVLNNIGLIYFKLKNYEKALEFYKQSLKFKKEINDEYDLDRLLINIGLTYNQLRNFEDARNFINDGFNVCQDNCSQKIKVEGKFGLGVTYFIQGTIEKDNKHFVNSKKYFLESYQLAKDLGNRRFQLENLIYLARIDLKLSKVTEAKNYLEQAEVIASRTEYNQLLIEIYMEFSNVYTQSRDFEKASVYQSKYIQLRDSILGDNLIKNLAKVQTDFEERENIATIATKEEVIKQQRSINFAIVIIAVLAILLIVVLYHSNKVKKRVNNALSEAKSIIEMKNLELDKKVADKTADLEKANESLIKVNEELDNFIYKTSHDIRGPLASLKGICNVALMDVKDEVAIGYLSKLDLTAEHLNTVLTRLLIINQINNSSLKPELINFNTLVEEVLALERKKGLPDRINVRKHIEQGIEYQSDKEFVRIILDNLIGNAIKFHNDSDRVEPFVDIRVEKESEELVIRVIDNGIGLKNREGGDKIFQMFSRASERSTTGGIGLYITKLAAEKIHGQVGLRTTSEGYTEFFVRIPIEPVIQRYESELL